MNRSIYKFRFSAPKGWRFLGPNELIRKGDLGFCLSGYGPPYWGTMERLARGRKAGDWVKVIRRKKK